MWITRGRGRTGGTRCRCRGNALCNDGGQHSPHRKYPSQRRRSAFRASTMPPATTAVSVPRIDHAHFNSSGDHPPHRERLLQRRPWPFQASRVPLESVAQPIPEPRNSVRQRCKGHFRSPRALQACLLRFWSGAPDRIARRLESPALDMQVSARHSLPCEPGAFTAAGRRSPRRFRPR